MISDTANLGWASLFGQIGGGLMSAVGSYYSAKSQKIALESQAAIADINAHISEMGAQSALAQGQQQVGALTMQAGQLKARQRAGQAASGVALGEGSAAEVRASTDIMKEIDANTLNANAVRSAWGYRMQGTNYQNQALMARANADAISPGAAMATSLLGGAGKVASSWYMLKKAGVLDDQDPLGTFIKERGWA